MRKYVTPADPKASIPDPSRGRDLPPGGMDVEWTPYWASMEARKEVTVADVAEAVPATDAAPASLAEPSPQPPAATPTTAPAADPVPDAATPAPAARAAKSAA